MSCEGMKSVVEWERMCTGGEKIGCGVVVVVVWRKMVNVHRKEGVGAGRTEGLWNE